jgi:hypothetical protein
MSDEDLRTRIDPSEYAALTRFLRGYLHQDAAVEYGSSLAAAHAFRRDADEGETLVVRSELDRLLRTTAKSPDTDLYKIIAALGSSWRFSSRKEIEQLRDALK